MSWAGGAGPYGGVNVRRRRGPLRWLTGGVAWRERVWYWCCVSMALSLLEDAGDKLRGAVAGERP